MNEMAFREIIFRILDLPTSLPFRTVGSEADGEDNRIYDWGLSMCHTLTPSLIVTVAVKHAV